VTQWIVAIANTLSRYRCWNIKMRLWRQS